MEIQRIRSVLFLWQKGFLLLVFVLLTACAILFIPGRYSNKAYIERFDAPTWLYGFGYTLIFFLIILGLYLSIAKWYKRDKLLFNEKRLRYKEEDFLVKEMQDIVFLRHPLKYKPKKNRTIFNGGGNNWLKFKYNGRKYSIEYFLTDKEEEEILNEIIKKWELVSDIDHGLAKEQDLLELYDSLSFKSTYDEFKFS
ncbi:hypothetical protein [Plebeiibacterium marinum]|uniref:Uncharacterized protein n=1 Tax=Plebeiibacterium marinum TaxID=2992111 RepID=A0AAE3MHM6_9BACT|nr:hypothetical protein [Plebeiobacterium marinum]MCW3808003.1 hypothetical protein [Plebeiobacterium marinum]